MNTPTEYHPRIVRGRTELWVPHKDEEIAFAFPSYGLNTYRDVGSKILKAGQKVPTGDITASLLHTAYGCTPQAEEVMQEPEFAEVRKTMKDNWLWVYSKCLWTSEGVYVVLDTDATGRSNILNAKSLEKLLKGGREISGVRFSQTGEVRFAPEESYRLGEHSPESFAKDGFIIASCGKEGAEKMGEVASKFRIKKPVTYGLEIKEGETPEQRVAAVDEGGGRLRFGGDYWDDYDDGHAFGVLN